MIASKSIDSDKHNKLLDDLLFEYVDHKKYLLQCADKDPDHRVVYELAADKMQDRVDVLATWFLK